MADFFASFPIRTFEERLLTDLSVRIKIKDSWLNDKKLYYHYQYQDHDKPEHLALKYYEDEKLHWLILLTNLIFDDFFDFPMNEKLFKKYLTQKYANNQGLKLVRILNHGSGYESGMYDDIPLTIINSEDLSSLGEDATVNITVTSGSISNIDVFKCGDNYDANTIFTIDNTYLGGTGSGFTAKINSFIGGYEYTQLTPHPIYRYQKHIRIIADREIQDHYYVIDKNSYINLFDQYPSNTQIITISAGDTISYEIQRRYPEITIFQKEFEDNEAKRLIKILKKEYAPFAVREIKGLLK